MICRVDEVEEPRVHMRLSLCTRSQQPAQAVTRVYVPSSPSFFAVMVIRK